MKFDSFKQIKYLGIDIHQSVNSKWWRLLIIIFSKVFYAILSYRIDRFGHLIFGKVWKVIRLPFIPIFWLFEIISNCDISYRADIGPGLLILHPSLGLVISGKAIIGSYPVFTGGNCIGMKESAQGTGVIRIGNHCTMGVNSSIIGPLQLGDHTIIAANSCVTKSWLDGALVGGVPAKLISHNSSDNN